MKNIIFRGIFLIFVFSCQFLSPGKHPFKYNETDSPEFQVPKNDTVISYSGESAHITRNDSIKISICIYKDLSYLFDFKLSVRNADTIGLSNDSRIIIVSVYQKLDQKLVDSFEYISENISERITMDCTRARSYITKYNLNKEILDSDYGDLIIADFNFDQREDMAVIYDSGGSSGPLYLYCVRTPEGRFKKDTFLSETMQFFPSKFRPKNKTLTTFVIGGMCHIGEHVYKYNDINQNLKEIRHRVRNICDD